MAWLLPISVKSSRFMVNAASLTLSVRKNKSPLVLPDTSSGAYPVNRVKPSFTHSICPFSSVMITELLVPLATMESSFSSSFFLVSNFRESSIFLITAFLDLDR